MANYSVLIFIALSLFVMQVFARRHHNFQQHFKRVYDFKCNEPQMRALRIIEIIDTGLEGKAFFPSMTVLHRCDSASGCCLNGDGFTCGPLETEEVKLSFHVTHLRDSDEYSRGSVTQQTVVAKNHTRCGCMHESELPR